MQLIEVLSVKRFADEKMQKVSLVRHRELLLRSLLP